MFRDDHEAALARVNALEVELSRARADGATQARRIAKLEDELERTTAELARVKPPAPKPIAETWPPPPPRSGAPVVVGATVIVTAIAAFGFVMTRAERAERAPVMVESVPIVTPIVAPEHASPDDVAVMIREAQVRAAQSLPGSVLVVVRGEGVTPEGKLHPEYGKLTVEFQRENTPPPIDTSRPIGAPQPSTEYTRFECLFVTRTARGWMGDGAVMPCFQPKNTGEVIPQCTTRNIWSRARVDGAPTGAIAQVRFDGSWRLSISDPRAQFDSSYDDNCVP